MISAPTLTRNQPDQALLNELEKSLKSALMQDIYDKVLKLAKVDKHVVVVGEIGSGKKRLAEIIHKNSSRSNGPFHSFYCVDVNEEEYRDAFSEHLRFEEEHITLRYDAIEKASGGVLYLDKFSQLPPQFMLDIIDSFVKGCEQLFRYDKASRPRLVISMNQEACHDILNTPVWETILRHLDPVMIMPPPLRERKEDIPVIIDFFLREIRERYGEWSELTISKPALTECFNYNWPGNIRQLKNAILHGAILSCGETIESHHLPFSMSWSLPYELDENKSM